MIKTAIIGAGKMGISHLSILGAHPQVDLVGVSDTSKIVTDAIKKYSPFPCFSDYRDMLNTAKPEAVFVAVPTKFHASMVSELLDRNMHVFAEKPFCLDPKDGLPLIEKAKNRGLVNQVGYHNKFIGTFSEVKRLIDTGALGEILHFTGEAYGPVVIRKKETTWRSDPKEGGGCLMDYASHVIDLINNILSPIEKVNGALLKSYYSTAVEDAVYSLVTLQGGVSGVLSVNWSDETYRKMSTSITILGTKGKIISDANELKVFFKSNDCPAGYEKGWNLRYITDLTPGVNFNLRGEEYTAQIDYFIDAILGKVPNSKNTFQSSWYTDRAIQMIRNASKS